MAERGGFEPPVQLLTVQRFSKPPPSATRPSLRRLSGLYRNSLLPHAVHRFRFPASAHVTFTLYAPRHLQLRAKKLLLLPLIAATFFMVSGGPYGIEDILGGAGFGWAIVILLVLPLIWSLPTALMIGELAAAIPAEGGFYVWVRRALGPFWGYQEGWLSLSASIFDMALYPSIFVLYLGKFSPALTAGRATISGRWLSSFFAARGICAARPDVGDDSVWLFAAAARALRRLRCTRLLARPHAASRHPLGPSRACARRRRSASPPRSWSRFGTTWAGTTPPPSRAKSKIRSATIRAP